MAGPKTSSHGAKIAIPGTVVDTPFFGGGQEAGSLTPALGPNPGFALFQESHRINLFQWNLLPGGTVYNR